MVNVVILSPILSGGFGDKYARKTTKIPLAASSQTLTRGCVHCAMINFIY